MVIIQYQSNFKCTNIKREHSAKEKKRKGENV